MPSKQRTYIAIDLKSFYASVECIDRGLDPMSTHLVVADASRTEKTICLAVSPSLKTYGISGRARLFEVVQRIKQVNDERRWKCRNYTFTGKSVFAKELMEHPDWQVDYIAAPPQMAHYIECSTRIYNIYLKYIAAEDIHVYSIDEVFMDVTNYLESYRMSAHNLAMTIIRDVLKQTGITATAGIGTNMYLCKVAMDIVAKKMPSDEDGVRIAELDEYNYRKQLWNHRPLTDFWRVGKGIAQKLEEYGIYTMGQIARCSLRNEALLYRLFGVNAELLIDHAWGWEPCTIDLVKAYRPESNSLSSGQVLNEPYTFKKARVVAHEMADAVALDLVDKRLVTDQIVLTVGYDIESLTNPAICSLYCGEVATDYYGRKVPKHAHGTANLDGYSSSAQAIIRAVLSLYDRIVNPNLLVRRLTLSINHVIPENQIPKRDKAVQLDLFTDYETKAKEEQEKKTAMEKERKMQETILGIKKKFGKNAILKGVNFEEGATAKERNNQIGGHKAYMDNYDDIINLPHHTSKVHKRMSMHSRAAQFAPFAALTGHNDAINETARLTETFSEPSDAEKASLDRKIGYLKNTLYERAAVSITYFVPDKRKAGGLYKKTVGAIKSIDSHEGIITMVDGTRIYTQHIRYIDGTFPEE